MAKKQQSQQMKDAYGQRFSQQDLTDPQENQIPQPLKTDTYQEGDLAFARAHLGVDANPSGDTRVPFAKGGNGSVTSGVPKAKKVTRRG